MNVILLFIRLLRFVTLGNPSPQMMLFRLVLLGVVFVVTVAISQNQSDQRVAFDPVITLPTRSANLLQGTLTLPRSTVSGTLNKGERHAWQFEGERGQTVNLRVRGDWDSTLELLPPRSTQPIAIDFNSGGGYSAFLCNTTLYGPGLYTAVVSGYLALPDRDAGAYTLSLESSSVQEAIPIAIGETAAGLVDTCDGDFYRITVRKGDSFEVTVIPDGDAELSAVLLSSRYSTTGALAVGRETTDAQGRTVERFSTTASADTELSIRVYSPMDVARDASYTIRVDAP